MIGKNRWDNGLNGYTIFVVVPAVVIVLLVLWASLASAVRGQDFSYTSTEPSANCAGWQRYGMEYWRRTEDGWVVAPLPQEPRYTRRMPLMQALREDRASAWVYPDTQAHGVCLALRNKSTEPLRLQITEPLWLRVCHEGGQVDWMMAVPPGCIEVALNTGSIAKDCNIRLKALVCVGDWERRCGIYGTLQREDTRPSDGCELAWSRDLVESKGAPQNLLKLCNLLAERKTTQRVAQASLDKLERGVNWDEVLKRHYVFPAIGVPTPMCHRGKPMAYVLTDVERDAARAIVESLSWRSKPALPPVVSLPIPTHGIEAFAELPRGIKKLDLPQLDLFRQRGEPLLNLQPLLPLFSVPMLTPPGEDGKNNPFSVPLLRGSSEDPLVAPKGPLLRERKEVGAGAVLRARVKAEE